MNDTSIMVSVTQRAKAAEILMKAKREDGLKTSYLSKVLGIPLSYVSFAMYRTKRPTCEFGYMCPPWAIQKILDWGKV